MIHVIKASGEREPFQEAKLRRSLRSAGADTGTVDEIVAAIGDELHEGITTRTIYRKAFRMLKHRSGRTAGRYKLKEALLELGPTGYPFEQFISELLRRLGYETRTGVIVQGHCVDHEVDVIAVKDSEHYIVECKFHNRKDHMCNVKVPLYVESRFRDIERAYKTSDDHRHQNHFGWVITNTRFTDDARQYARCMHLQLLSWDYPKGRALRDLIERVNLHPITCLSALQRPEKQALLNLGIVFCSQLAADGSALERANIPAGRRKEILREAAEISTTNNHHER